MESQDSSQGTQQTQQDTQPDTLSADDNSIIKPRDLLAKLVPLHPTAEYLLLQLINDHFYIKRKLLIICNLP